MHIVLIFYCQEYSYTVYLSVCVCVCVRTRVCVQSYGMEDAPSAVPTQP